MIGRAQKQRRPVSKEKKILIVDDDQTILYLLRKLIAEMGFQVSVARDGLEAIEKLRGERPDLIITDLKTPSLSGAELISAIHQTHEAVPIMVMTAYPNLYPEMRANGVVRAYFRKPFDIDEMLSSVEKILAD